MEGMPIFGNFLQTFSFTKKPSLNQSQRKYGEINPTFATNSRRDPQSNGDFNATASHADFCRSRSTIMLRLVPPRRTSQKSSRFDRGPVPLQAREYSSDLRFSRSVKVAHDGRAAHGSGGYIRSRTATRESAFVERNRPSPPAQRHRPSPPVIPVAAGTFGKQSMDEVHRFPAAALFPFEITFSAAAAQASPDRREALLSAQER